MATPSEKLAQSLEVLQSLISQNGNSIVKSDEISRTHRDRLLSNGFLQEIIKGWYIASNPEYLQGDTTSWYSSFWDFAKVYLNSRFGKEWCLSPDQSLKLHGGNKSVPVQLLVRSPKARNKATQLMFNTSIFDLRSKILSKNEFVNSEGLNLYSLESGLVACGADFFEKHTTDARTCLSMIKNASQLLEILLDGGHSVIAGRLVGAFRNIGNDKIANDIYDTMKSVGYDVRELDPFEEKLKISFSSRELSPYASRIRIMWMQMRQPVLNNFVKTERVISDTSDYLKHVEDSYSKDAYHSLSIEGYKVTPNLIERVRSGNWNPNENEKDKEQKNAMAARGYHQAFQAVKESLKTILEGENPGQVVDKDHGKWYRELFAPSVSAGILKASDLAGYRNGPVYINGSMHTPLNHEAVRDAMPVFFELLENEAEESVRVVLGHFIFVYIHPYYDGNGRIARFLMNAMIASGGLPWSIIPVELRNEYMAALEEASVNNDIIPFTRFISSRHEEFLD